MDFRSVIIGSVVEATQDAADFAYDVMLGEKCTVLSKDVVQGTLQLQQVDYPQRISWAHPANFK